MNRFLVALFCLAFANVALSDVKLVIKDVRGNSSTIYSNGQQARVEGGQMPGYGIIDFDSGELLVIDQQRKQVMKLSLANSNDASAAGSLGVSLKDKGGGRKIAGYLTRKYQIIAGGQDCGTVYASRKLLDNDDVNALFNSMTAMQGVAGGMSSRLSGRLTLCQRANLELSDAMASSGVPMRVQGADGKVIAEVVSVDTDSPAVSYQVPNGLTAVDMNEVMGQAAQQMQNMPEMEQVMQQMEAAGGQMTPEMKQQLEQLQKMLQQLEQ